MAYLEGVMDRALLFMGTALLSIVSLAFPVQAGVMLTGATPSTFSGPGETITFTYRLDEENITVNSMSLSGSNVPVSGLTCTPAFPIDPFEITNCTATYTTTASDVSDILQYGGTYSLETIGGPRSGVVSSSAFVNYVPPTPQAIVTWDSMFLMAFGGPGGFLPNGGSVDIGTTVTFDFTFPSGWTYASLPSGCNIVHDSGDTWQGTITETCHVSGNETIILLHGVGSTELVEGEYGYFNIWTDGGVSPLTMTLDSGAVPTGMTFSNGHVSGIPSVTGSFEFTVGATNEYGHSASQAFVLTVVGSSTPAPTITAISPNNGPEAGGTTVTITGTNLTGATDVTFGGTAATGVVVNSATSIIATTPPGTAGAVDVAVTTPGGTVTEAGGFAYEALPVLTISDATVVEGNPASFVISLDRPASSPVTMDIATADGTAIAGEDYEANSVTGVTIEPGMINRSFSRPTYDDSIPEPDETFFVNVTNVTGATVADGQGTATIQDNDVAMPTITGISPDTGPEAGGTTVTITGTNLTGATDVTFGGVAATSYTVESATLISAVTPAGTAGAVDVSVTASGGTVTEPAGFTYGAPAPNPYLVTVSDGTYTAGETILFNVYFDDAVVASGNPRLPIDIGGTTRYADYDVHGGVVVRFRYVVQAGDLAPSGIGLGPSILLNGGTIESTGGTAANLTLNGIPDLSGVIVDAVAPTVASSAVSGSPAPDATTVLFDVTFSEQVNGVDPSDFVLTRTDSATGAVGGIGTADGVTYHVNITGISGIGSLRLDVQANGSIADLAENAMVAAYTSGTPWARGGSTDATLSGLVPSVGTLDPAFDPATTAYDVAVDNATDSITLTPTAAGPNATITVDGQPVASGSASQAIALAVGTTAIPVVVTAEDTTTTLSYTVTVTRAASTDATLSALTPGAGTLDPTFDPAITAYDVAVDNATDSITLTPTAAGPNATITVDGQTVASGSASQAIALAVGATAIPVVVTAEDNTTTRTYTVTVTRAASADATLSSLVPGAGALDPAFDPATTAYDVAVDNATDSITLMPTAADANATITVDGQTVASGSASQAIALAVGTTAIPVIVTAEDGTTTQTYTVTVTRAASADATLASLVPSVGTLDPAFDPATAGYDVAVDNATDSITLTPTATDANATITVAGQAVASGSASQAIALAVGATAIPVVVTAEDNATTRTYTVTVTRAASANARLAGLTPSAGALDPAFDSDTLDYAVAVANAVDSLTLTPTADDANATITVAGQTVASGSASQVIALSVGSTAIQVVVTAEDGMTSRAYAVTVERAQPVPTVVSRTIEINAGETASVDLTEGASGSPFTNAAIVDLSNAEAGTARIERDGQSYRLVFASSSTYTGGADIRFTLSNAIGTSAPGTIAFTILGRPNPSQDPEVIGLLTAQVDAAKRFAQVQTRNFNDRLEQLHDEGDRRSNSMNLRLGYNAEEKSGDREIRELVERAHEVPGLLGYAPQDAGGSGSGAFASDDEAASTSSAGNGGVDLGPYAIWTGGYINFGESDKGGLDLDHTMVGVSAGIDYRFSQKFVAGFGVGFGRDRTDVGANGTQSTGRAYSAAVYGSYKPFDNFFLDGLVGGSWLDFDSRRYVTATGDFATGNRSGHQLFGSLTAAYEFRDKTWLFSPYGRVELSRTWLDGFAEDGGGGFGLRYGDQSIDTVSGVIGLRAEYAFKTSWGSLTPGARVEYTHDFAGSSRINLGYLDLDHLPYWLDIEASNRSYMTLGLSLDAQLPQDWTLGFDYRTAFGSDQRDHAFGLEIGKRF